MVGAAGALARSTGRPATVFGSASRVRSGLAAGMDKDGIALPAWPALGFGFAEVGTVTAQAAAGQRASHGCSGCASPAR